MTTTTTKAALVGVYQHKKDKGLVSAHLDELAALCHTYGFEVFEHFPTFLKTIKASTYITQGKLEELKAQAAGCDLFIFDDEITPNQQRNLEKILEKPVLDRSELILEVFAKQARTKEARLQIELAKAQYELPRLRRMWTHLSRQSGSGQLKGEGEQQIEIDRRLLKKKIAKLLSELKVIAKARVNQRKRRVRSDIAIFSIVGYTNAGKSTLMNVLCKSDVLTHNKLFATLDTRTRTAVLSQGKKCLLIDTVGFVRKLPHHLVASFRSTLEEAAYTDVILHVIDASNPAAIDQAETTFEVLKDIGADSKPMITVLNKTDLVKDRTVLHQLRLKYPKTVCISSLSGDGIDLLKEKMLDCMEKF